MSESPLLRLWRALADWWSFEMGTIGNWLFPSPETPVDRAIREEGERIRRGSGDRFRPSEHANDPARATRPRTGALVLVVGLVMAVHQYAREAARSSRNQNRLPYSRSMTFSPTGGFKVQTTYVGILITAIGALLEIVGYLSTAPWMHRDRRSLPSLHFD
jgi:hypothetical protein